MKNSAKPDREQMKGADLDWCEWLSALVHMTSEILFQRFYARHLPKRLALPTLTGLQCIVTGATSGIGLETAKQLAESGASVVLACRNTPAAEVLVQEWSKSSNTSLEVEVMELDLLSLSSVRSFCTAWEAHKRPLNVLINNAGICSMRAPQKFSEDGFEEHIQVNHLAPALLTLLLLPSLLRSGASRIINVNSDAECFGVVDPDDLNLVTGKRKYSNFIAYSGSKLAQIYFGSILESRLPLRCGVRTMCVNPGMVTTNVTRTLPKLIQLSQRHTILFFNPLEGARSVLFCATSDEALEHAIMLKSVKWSVCAIFSSDCKPRLKTLRPQELSKALKVWERTLELIEVPNDIVEKLVES